MFTHGKSSWQILLSQFKSAIIYLLFAAALLSLVFGDIPEFIAILVVILINSLIGFVLERQAVKSMEALRSIDKNFCRVYRDGTVHLLETTLLVPGDMVFLEGGDLVPADGRLIISDALQVNESVLTGESMPVEKTVIVSEKDEKEFSFQKNMLYKGTSVTRGTARFLVTATGKSTEIGKITLLTAHAEDDEIPLNKKLASFSRRLIWITLVLAAAFVGIGFFSRARLICCY